MTTMLLMAVNVAPFLRDTKTSCKPHMFVYTAHNFDTYLHD